MKHSFLFLAFFVFFCFSSFGREFFCKTNQLTSFSHPWSESADFITLNFQGSLAAQAFPNIGEPGAQYFSVIMLKDWCKFLENTILCETPSSALVDVETSSEVDGPKKTVSLRYFLTILNYRDDGWAFLKIRGKRLDDLPPLNLNAELPVGSCRISEE